MTAWGPWLSHDGRGCPCVGQFADIIHHEHAARRQTVATGGGSWTWGDLNDKQTWTKHVSGLRCNPVVRYRIRRPKGLETCRRIASLTDREVERA